MQLMHFNRQDIGNVIITLKDICGQVRVLPASELFCLSLADLYETQVPKLLMEVQETLFEIEHMRQIIKGVSSDMNQVFLNKLERRLARQYLQDSLDLIEGALGSFEAKLKTREASLIQISFITKTLFRSFLLHI